MSINLDYIKNPIKPFESNTNDILNIISHMKSEPFICVQCLSNSNSIYIGRNQLSDESDNVLQIDPYEIDLSTIQSVSANSYIELSKKLDQIVLKYILSCSEQCECLNIDINKGIFPCLKSAVIALTSNLLKISNYGILSNKLNINLIKTSLEQAKLKLISYNTDKLILFNIGTNSFDGGIFFIPLKFSKQNNEFILKYIIFTDDPMKNFICLLNDKDDYYN